MKGKQGWIKIVEAFIAILLVAGVLLFVINKGYIGKSDISDRVYQAQISILREIELDDNLRTQILNAELEGDVPQDVLDKIEQRKPDYLTCVAKICKMDVICESGETPLEKDIYAQPVAITTDSESFDPRQLKLFCWTD
jgi:hypothetical protein